MPCPRGKRAGRRIEQLTFPRGDLVRVHIELLCKLSNPGYISVSLFRSAGLVALSRLI